MPTPLPKLYGDENATAINNCIKASCGPADQNWNAYSVIYRPGKNLTPSNLWTQSFKPRLKELLELEKQNDIAVTNRMDQLIKSGTAIQPGQPLQAMIVFMQILTSMNDHLGDVLQYNAAIQQMTVNEAVLNKLIETLPASQRLAAKLIMTKAFLPMALGSQADGDQFENRLTKRLKAKYFGQALKTAQQLDATNLLTEANRIRGKLGNLLSSALINDQMIALLQKAKLGQDPTKLESQDYMEAVSPIELFGSIYDNGETYAALMSVPLDLNLILQAVRDNSYASKKLDEARNRNLTDRMNTIENTCSFRIQYAFDLNASPLRLRQATDMAESVKLAAKQTLDQSPLSENNSEVLSAVSNIQFALPDSNTQLAR